MSPKEPDKRPQHENEDLDAEEIAEGPAELFEADYDREPVSEADAPVPPG